MKSHFVQACVGLIVAASLVSVHASEATNNAGGAPSQACAAKRQFRAAARSGVSAEPSSQQETMGMRAFEEGHFDLAFLKLSNLALEDSRSMYYLGAMYEQGKGTPKRLRDAVRLYARSAERGEALAQHALGRLFSSGTDFPRNYAESAAWFRRAAEQGHAEAQWRVGLMYRNGQGVPRDLACAFAWLALAGEGQSHEARAAAAETLASLPNGEHARARSLKAELQSIIDHGTK